MSVNQSIKPITIEWKENLSIGGCDLVKLANDFGYNISKLCKCKEFVAI